MKIFDKLSLAVFFLFPYYAVLTFVFLVLELFSYRGFLRQFLFFDSLIFLGAAFILGALSLLAIFRNKILEKNKYVTHYLLDINALFFPGLVFVYYLLSLLESSNYPNYVFSVYHLTPNFFVYLIFFSSFLLIMKLLIVQKKAIINFVAKRSRKQSLLLGTIIFLLTLHFFTNVVPVFSKIVSSTGFIVKNPTLSYEQKMETKWGMIVPYSKFVNSITEPNSVIVVPPQLFPWGSSGNAGLMRYFLYPRSLKNGTLEDAFAKEKNPDYVLIAKGAWPTENLDYGWPKQDITAEKVYIWDKETKIVREYDGPYLWEDERFYQQWGVIKLSRELP
jgi:hypothetical protein